MTDSKTVVEDLAVWRKITCQEREAIVRERGYYYPDKRAGGLCVHSARTDHYGQYGLPMAFTEWGTYEDEPVLRDVLHPALDLEHNPGAKDRLPCEHYVWGPL